MKTQNDNVYALYLNEIKSYPLLSESEEKSLLKKIASGDNALYQFEFASCHQHCRPFCRF